MHLVVVIPFFKLPEFVLWMSDIFRLASFPLNLFIQLILPGLLPLISSVFKLREGL